MSQSLMTIRETRRALRQCAEVVVQVRFGVNEAWTKISKAEAKLLLDALDPAATPDDAEMYAGHFGTYDGRTLFLG
jgi:hypothetical protein